MRTTERFGVQIKYFRDAHTSLRRLREMKSQLLAAPKFDEFLVVLVGISEKAALALSASIDKTREALPMAKIIIGFLTSSGEFIELSQASDEY